ncbi:MAG TPA: hypothetical protein QGH28_06770, partial [Chloroflexota bacterium]|nr:hypothetical protein [Chloroflexota bacterium]
KGGAFVHKQVVGAILKWVIHTTRAMPSIPHYVSSEQIRSVTKKYQEGLKNVVSRHKNTQAESS